MTTPEGVIKKAIKDYLRGEGITFMMVPNGSYGSTGAPDIVACYDGRFIGIEAKTVTGRQSDWQKKYQSDIEASGGIYILARSVDDVKGLIDELKSKKGEIEL